MTYLSTGVRTAGVSFFTGLLVGGVAGVLVAPQSGAKTRRRLASAKDDVCERAEEMVEEAKDMLKTLVHRR